MVKKVLKGAYFQQYRILRCLAFKAPLQLSLYLFYLFILVISFLISCDKLVHAEFMLYI